MSTAVEVSLDDAPRMGKRHRLWAAYCTLVQHRWIKIIFFGIAVTFTSCLYAGWQQYSLILLKGGKYSWLCDEGSTMNDDNGFPSCIEQEQAVARLFAIATALELLGAIFAGVALDQLGPKLTALLGETLGLAAMVMMVASKEGMNLLPLSMVITGVAINLVAFPALILEDYFPTAAATTSAFVVSCQCLSSAIAPIMWEVWKWLPTMSFVDMWSFYLGVIWVPASFFYVLTLPLKREIPATLIAGVPESASDTEEGQVVTSTSGMAEVDTTALAQVASGKSFKKACFSMDFAVMNLVNMILMLQTAYYQVVVRSISGPAISDFVGWGLPTQAVWGLIMGRIVDVIKTPSMAGIIFVGYAATYLMVQLPRGWVQYITASLFLFFMSYAFTVKYSYIQERFPPQLFGRLLGVAGGLGGVSVLLTNLLVGSLTVTFWCNFLASLSIIGIILSIYLSISMRRRTEKRHLELAEPPSNQLCTPLISPLSPSTTSPSNSTSESMGAQRV